MVTPFPSPDCPVSGGVQAAAASLCDALAARDDTDVHVLVLGRDGAEGESWLRGSVSVSKVGYRQRMAALFGFSRAVHLVSAEVARVCPDVVHAQGLGAEGVAVSKLKGVPKCVTPHGDVDRDVTGNVRGPWALLNARARLRLADLALRRFDVAISISDVRDLDGARRVVPIANPLNPEFLSAPTSNIARNGVLMVATIKRIKRIDLVIMALEAMKSRSPAVLTIAGGVEDARYHGELLRLASRCRHVEVNWAGQVDAAALCELYDRSAALVVASDWEVSPMCIAEAMARRCPVVASNVPGNLAMVRSGRGQSFEAGDADSLAAVLAETLNVESSRSSQTEVALDWAVGRFAPAAIAAQTAALYTDIVNDGISTIMRKDVR